VALDGTGYGTDGTIWGGEFLVADRYGFKRAGHLEYVPLLGGEAAIRKPYRMAFSYIDTLLGGDYIPGGMFQERYGEFELMRQQLGQGINCPPTSSAGRLFDAISALLGVRAEADYEAQAAIELEMIAGYGRDNSGEEAYPFLIEDSGGMKVVRLKDMFAAIIADIGAGVPVADISFRFHLTAARLVSAMCLSVREESGINRVALSGGVFQNRLLLRLASGILKADGFDVLTHRLVPCNDGGIALGQAAIAASKGGV
jgi:hydrogenase maturation protein HypF